MHEYELLANLAICLLAGLTFGFITQKLGLSPILGYLIAGVAIGPHTPGLVADLHLAQQLAEVGVILLMFGVGLHFHLDDLLAVKKVAIPGALGQSAVATGLGVAIGLVWGWGLGAGLVLGIAVSVASTVVLTRVLEDNDAIDTVEGHVAIGWLVVEDVFTVVVLVLMPVLKDALGAGSSGLLAVAGSLGLALVKLAVLTGLILYGGPLVVPRLLGYVARTRSRELFTLTVLVLALGIAVGAAAIFGASVALGAFLAGMVVGRSPLSHQAAADALPMRDAFAVLFFVSVGMLFVPSFIVTSPGLVAAVLAVVLLGKPLAAFGLVMVLGYSVRTALTVSISLAQIGEFSFILSQLATKLGLLPEAGQTVLVAAALISIGLNPLLFRAIAPTERWLRRRPRLFALLNRRAETHGATSNALAEKRLADGPARVRAVVVGHGVVGRTVSRLLREFDIEPVIVELNLDTVAALVFDGGIAIYGDASNQAVLRVAGVGRARYLVVTLPDPGMRMAVMAAARAIAPDVKVFVRARFLAEREPLEQLGVTAIAYEEVEAAVGLARLLLLEVGAPEERIVTEARRIRELPPT